MTWGTGTNGEKTNAENEKATVSEKNVAERTFHQAYPPPSYFPPVESTGIPAHPAINSLQTAQHPSCRQTARNQIDAVYVQKFSRICAPICQIMSIGVAMYFFYDFIMFMICMRSCTQETVVNSRKILYAAEVVLFSFGLIALAALCPALKKNNPCMLSPFIGYQYLTSTLIIFGLISWMFFGLMWSVSGVLFFMFFAAFLCFSNYTMCQVIKLRKVMFAGTVRELSGGAPVYFSPSAEVMAVPVYPGATVPLGNSAP